MSKIDDLVHEWHTSPDDNGELHEYLGMTWEEYGLWAEKCILPDRLKHLDQEDD